MFASPAFWLVTIIEGVAIRGATALLDATGYLDYVIACTAVVVGVHFLAMGRLFWVGAYGLGAALIAAGLAGASVGLGGGDAAAIKATTGLLAGASLFAAGGFGVVYSRRVTRRGASRQRRA